MHEQPGDYIRQAWKRVDYISVKWTIKKVNNGLEGKRSGNPISFSGLEVNIFAFTHPKTDTAAKEQIVRVPPSRNLASDQKWESNNLTIVSF